MWGKQFYHYDVARWLDGDPASAPPPPGRRHGRNAALVAHDSFDVISMPDPWEYPWYAAWDLAFHCVAHRPRRPRRSPRSSCCCCCREWYMHPNGQIPAYEWAFGDVNPPVHAWAALRVFEIDGGRDYDFLARVMHKLLLNFTWWVNRKDAGGNNVFEGGFLGLDNVGPFDRSAALPVAGVLEQSDGTGWMAMYALNLLEMSLGAGRCTTGPTRTWRRSSSSTSRTSPTAAYEQGLWDDEDGFFYDVLRAARRHQRAAARCARWSACCRWRATTGLPPATLDRLPELAAAAALVPGRTSPSTPTWSAPAGRAGDGQQQRLLSVVGPDQLRADPGADARRGRVPVPVRAAHAVPAAPRQAVHGRRSAGTDFTVGYEPAESTSGLFGGNSNWRGPIWFPVNFLLIEALRALRARSSATTCMVEYPTGSGSKLTLGRDRRRPVPPADRAVPARRATAAARSTAANELFQTDPDWQDLIAVPRVLPRRQRRRPGRLAPDRLDRAGGRPDHRAGGSTGEGTTW